MSSTTTGAFSGAVLGVVAILLAQQLALLDLSVQLPAIEDLLVAVIVGGVAGAGIGAVLGAQHRREAAAADR